MCIGLASTDCVFAVYNWLLIVNGKRSTRRICIFPMTINMSANRHITGGFKQESGVHPVSIVLFFVFLLTTIARILESNFFNKRNPIIEAQPNTKLDQYRSRRGYKRAWQTLASASSECWSGLLAKFGNSKVSEMRPA